MHVTMNCVVMHVTMNCVVMHGTMNCVVMHVTMNCVVMHVTTNVKFNKPFRQGAVYRPPSSHVRLSTGGSLPTPIE